jgi:membrane protein DedA with SNARE-associated domain
LRWPLDWLFQVDVLSNPWLLSLATFVSEDLAYLYGLIAVQLNQLPPWTFILFYSMGVVAGDIGIYAIGFFLRFSSNTRIGRILRKWFTTSPHKKPSRFGRFEEFLVCTRFIPGSRIPTYIYCGLSQYSLLKFSVILFVSGLFYTSFGILLISLIPETSVQQMNGWEKLATSVIVACSTILFFKLLVFLRQTKLRYGESLKPLWIKIYRLKHLEFWPPLMFYLPFVPYYIYLLFRYRGFTDCLSSNPCIYMSGMIGENKSELDHLIQSSLPSHHLKTFALPKNNINTALDVIHRQQLKFPLIVKPDSGQRGGDVELAQNSEHLSKVLDKSRRPLVIQEYCPHELEWGLFYVRLPGRPQGSVFSITEKQFPKVTGDGTSNLWQLVQSQHELRWRFDWIFSSPELDPLSIPSRDKTFKLVERGNHSKGCLFRDGSRWIESPEADTVSRALDKIADFHIGRVDIRFESFGALQKGEFKIIEINGAGAESTNIYDPSLSAWKVYSTLAKQWSLIFKIGRINRKLASTPQYSLIQFFKEVKTYRKRAAG